MAADTIHEALVDRNPLALSDYAAAAGRVRPVLQGGPPVRPCHRATGPHAGAHAGGITAARSWSGCCGSWPTSCGPTRSARPKPPTRPPPPSPASPPTPDPARTAPLPPRPLRKSEPIALFATHRARSSRAVSGSAPLRPSLSRGPPSSSRTANALFAAQRGLVTSRQAQALGLSRAAAARRERAVSLNGRSRPSCGSPRRPARGSRTCWRRCSPPRARSPRPIAARPHSTVSTAARRTSSSSACPPAVAWTFPAWSSTTSTNSIRRTSSRSRASGVRAWRARSATWDQWFRLQSSSGRSTTATS